MATYAKFTIQQLGKGYIHHAKQDCAISQRIASEILHELVMRKGQRAAKIRHAFGVDTRSDTDGTLCIYEAGDDCSEPLAIIHKDGTVGNIYADEHLLNALEVICAKY